MEFDNHKDFFDKVGDGFIHPIQYGEGFCPITIEQMYQQFKARLLSEIADEGEK